MSFIKFVGLLLSVLSIRCSPISRVHFRFEQQPHIEEHAIATDGGRLIDQHSYLSIGKRDYFPAPSTTAGNQYQRMKYIDANTLNYERPDTITPDFSDGLAYPDPLLLTGEAAYQAANRIYGRGELFFKEIPHERALQRNQEVREANGLYGNILRSSNPSTPSYRYSF